MRNLARITNYYNRIEAWKDWEEQAERARKKGRADLIQKFRPPKDAGWRKIDKSTTSLRSELEGK